MGRVGLFLRHWVQCRKSKGDGKETAVIIPPIMHILAGDQRLSDSIIWQIQRNYFLRDGIRAWQDDIVPSDISSNPFMARAYAQVVLGYLQDCVMGTEAGALPFNRNEPIYIVELGAGSGRLAHHFLHQFFPRLNDSPLADLQVKYVMTDFVPSLLDFWRGHAKFKEWAGNGRLDYALFDVMAMDNLVLQHSQHTLTPDNCHNPIIFIANYFFDSIPQDSFVIEDGQLNHNLLSVYSDEPEPNLDSDGVWDELELEFEAMPLAERPYAQQPYNDILTSYEITLPDTVISFPNIGLDCMRFWQRFGNGRNLWLTADRGHTLPDSLIDQDDPYPNLHGSFSLMVNYHAIGQFVLQNEGQLLQPPHYQDNLQVVGYLLGNQPNATQMTQRAFNEWLIENNPDDYFALKQIVETQYESMSLAQLLSFLRLSVWDATVFVDCFPYLLAQLQEESDAWHEDVYAVIQQVWQQHLPLGETDDLVTKINTLLDFMDDELI